MFEWVHRIVTAIRLIGTERGRMVARYRRLNGLGMKLSHLMLGMLDKSIIHEGAKNLGMLRRGVIHLESDGQYSALMDHCIHDIRRYKMNLVERFLQESPPEDSDAMVVLQALKQARYCLFAVERLERGVGVHGRDLLRDEPLFLVDVRLSYDAFPGLVLATRIMAPEGIAQTTGAAIPAEILSASEQVALQQGILTKHRRTDLQDLSPSVASELTTSIIRNALRYDFEKRIAYLESGAEAGVILDAAPSVARQGRPSISSRVRPRGKAPCPCGSGKKFRHCCGKSP